MSCTSRTRPLRFAQLDTRKPTGRVQNKDYEPSPITIMKADTQRAYKKLVLLLVLLVVELEDAEDCA